MFTGLVLLQTLPVFGQVSQAIDQGIDLSGDMISGVVGQTVPVENAGQLTKDGFNILKSVYHVMRSVHHFITSLITAVATEGQSEEEAKKMAEIIGIGSIIATVVIGAQLLKGMWRHLFLIAIVIFLVIIGASFLDNKLSMGF